MLKENVILIVFLIFGISFVVSMNISGYYAKKLTALFKKKYPNLKYKLTPSLLEIMFPLGYFTRYMKYVWSDKPLPKDILFFIKKIRFYQKLGLALFILTAISPFFVEVFY